MTKKTHKQKDGTIWEWEETKETQQALKHYLSVSSGNYEETSYTQPQDINNN